MASSYHHLKLDNVSFSYPEKRVLTDLTVRVPAGRVTGLIGENGSGKSTVLGLLTNTLKPDVGTVTTPNEVGYLPQETSLPFQAPAGALIEAAVAELRRIEQRIEELSQNLYREKAANEFDALLHRAEETGVWELDSKIAKVLSGLSLSRVPLTTPLGQMSGGQRRRFALAALLLRPVDALILDEPTNHLDDAGMDFLIGELRAFSGPALVASHDRYFLDEVADQLIDLDPGLDASGGFGSAAVQGTVYTGGYSDYLRFRDKVRNRWRENYNVQQQERQRLENRKNVTEAELFHHHETKTEQRASAKFYADRAAKTHGNRVRAAVSRLEQLEEQLLPKPPEPLVFQGIPSTVFTTLAEPAVHVRHAAIPGRLAPVNLKVQPGEQWLVVGPNGSGKSTLLNIINKRGEGALGEVRIPEEVTIRCLSQDDEWEDEHRTAAEVFAAHTPPGVPTLTDLGLLTPATEKLPLSSLSFGQRRRVSLGIILTNPPDVLLLDEPTNHLSLALVEDLERAIDTYPGTLIMATHDRWIRRRWQQQKGKKMLVLEQP